MLVVGADHKVAQEPVTVGDQIGQNYIVRSGLTEGEMVIVDGIQKVKVGNTVSETIAPAATMSARRYLRLVDGMRHGVTLRHTALPSIQTTRRPCPCRSLTGRLDAGAIIMTMLPLG